MKKSNAVVKAEVPSITGNVLAAGEFGIHLISEIRISPDNRKRFNEVALQELAASIRSMGVAQPILVRPVTPTEAQPERFEIVAGERRYRASKIADLSNIPAMVRELTDVDAAKIRILENLQREDPHPLEEAEGYEQLMMKHGYSADQLADEIKKSRSYIYGRLKLCALSTEVREEFLSDAISASTALLIARIPTPALQQKALKEITIPNSYPQEPMSYRRAAEHIQHRYMLDLATAIFQTTDGKLLASAGSCSKCPKRTGNQPEIFEDVKGADVCTDPDCFSEKKAAHHTRTLEQANKKGIPVLEGKAVSEFYGDRWNCDGELVTGTENLHHFNRNAPSTKNQGTPIDLLAKDLMPEPAAYIKDSEGEMTAVYKRVAVQAALEKNGICETVEEHATRMATANTTDTKPSNAKQAEAERAHQDRITRAANEQNFRITLYRKLRLRGASGFSLQSLREFAKLMVRDDNSYVVPTDLIGDVYPFERSTDEAVCAYIDQASLPEVQMILVDMALGECLNVCTSEIDDLNNAWSADTFKTLELMATNEGISPFMVRLDMKMATIALADIGDGELADFIRVNPGRIEELKDYIVANRPYCLTLLEAAALLNGLEYWQGKFIVMADKDASLAGTNAKALEQLDTLIDASTAATVTVIAAERQAEPASEEGDDAEQLAAQMTEDAAKPVVGKPAKGKAAAKLTPACTWPFPKTAAEALTKRELNGADPAVEHATETAAV